MQHVFLRFLGHTFSMNQLKQLAFENFDLQLPAELLTAEAFLQHLMKTTFPEALFLFNPVGSLPPRHILEKPLPGMGSIRLTKAAMAPGLCYTFRLVHAELLLPLKALGSQLGSESSALSWSAYFARSGAPGLLPSHRDTHDVHVFQCFGERLWRIGENEHWLRPGDLVRIPMGTPHQVLETRGDSLHVSAGVHFPNMHSVLKEFPETHRHLPFMMDLVLDKEKFNKELGKFLAQYRGDV
jgi:hypothetical protein